MNLKQELDALIESTMAFANGIKRSQPIPDLTIALRIAEQTLADTLKPMTPPTTVVPLWTGSERDEIRQRVSSFKAHQEKITREREDYYLHMRAKMLAPEAAAGVTLDERLAELRPK
jgi:hypothetical protein